LSNTHTFRTISAATLWLGTACLPPTCGCSRPLEPESSQRASRESSDRQTRKVSAEVEALSDRLQAITEEVAASAERRVYGVHLAANYQTEQAFPQRVRAVCMNVNVYWCDDGCIDGPAQTPVKNEDLLLLKPFADSLTTLDVQHTEITDVGLETIGDLLRLESLNLAGTAIDGRGLAHLASLDKLQHLDLRDTAIQPEHLQTLDALTSLRTIHLPEAVITDDVLAGIGRLAHLRSLILAKAPISDRGLASLVRLKQLEALDLSETGITDAGLTHLAGLTNLRQLRLSHTRITGAGLFHLARLASLQELDLAETAVDDAGLAHLADMRRLATLQLTGTQVRGYGLAHLRDCQQLRAVTLPPIPPAAVPAVNAVKSWHRLSLTLIGDDHLPPTDSATSVTISNMPGLSHLQIISECPLQAVYVEHCPQLAGLAVSHNTVQRPGTSLHLHELQVLRQIDLAGAFRELDGDGALDHVTRIVLEGSLTSDTVRSINRCRFLESLDMKVTEVTGAPIPITELQSLPRVLDARVRLETLDASWLLRLIGKMPALKRLDLRGMGLTAPALASLSTCTQLEYLGVRGIDDSGEPLEFLNVMPKLDQCLVLGCPRVGRIRLTKQAGVRRLYFKYGRLDELAVDGAPNLTAVYLGHEAFGYNDDDARLNKLDIGSLTVRDTASLLYLMVDGLESTVPFTQISLADTPKLRSLLLRAPPAERQPTKCRLMTEGAFPKLVQRRLFHLRADQASLDRLNESPILHGGDLENVEVYQLFLSVINGE
jgi:Leucine-rich repeat (LRR) protein